MGTLPAQLVAVRQGGQGIARDIFVLVIPKVHRLSMYRCCAAWDVAACILLAASYLRFISSWFIALHNVFFDSPICRSSRYPWASSFAHQPYRTRKLAQRRARVFFARLSSFVVDPWSPSEISWHASTAPEYRHPNIDVATRTEKTKRSAG